ncbi:DUF2384 domain-containing protein [Duganella sp. FT109W]|uniref:DUF2384 domain-containing protein n=1 Tax=Duganella margarita TaxID=2692170 RepID=A0ABW9WHJ3_9BURK|nr:antitoxin Xre/MbcA/ParS toxin-binding domain-containing protein [Duganella margarita]MYN40341.1 DUF2384 domain-containing protein [Duganella margarita]
MAKQTIQFQVKPRRQRTGGLMVLERLSNESRRYAGGGEKAASQSMPTVGESQALFTQTLDSISTLDRRLRDVIALVQQIIPDVDGTFDPVLEQTPIRLHDPVQERLRQRAATAVLNGTEWLTSAQVDALAPGADKRNNAHARANRLLGEGRVFAIEQGGRKHYPRYAFDALGTPHGAVREVLQAFGDAPPLRVASWFESTSAALDGRRPRELLDSDPVAVVRAAREHVAGPLHG